MALNQNDLKQIRTAVKQEVKSVVQQELTPVKDDIKSIKETLDNLVKLTQDGLGNLLVWTDEIHKTIVKKNRVLF